MNTEINFIIESYLQKPNSDYAYLLNGPWGCGKTFYIQKELRELAEANSYRYIYLSLNGVEDEKQIKRILAFHLLYSKKEGASYDSNTIDNFLELGRKLPASIGGKLFNALSTAKQQTENFLFEKIDFTKILIVFDDLERVSAKIHRVDLMGSIYENYTKNGVKTIFIADEKNIKDEKYDLAKEKLIRRTIAYNPNFAVQVRNFISYHFENEEELITDMEFIIETFSRIEIKNLRTISFIIDNYLQVIKALKNKELHFSKRIFFINIMILTKELKEGKLTIENGNALKRISKNPLFYKLNEKKDDEKSYAEKFHEKYNVKNSFGFFYIESIMEFVQTGFLNDTKLKQDVEAYFNKKNPKEDVIEKLTRHSEIEEEELKTSIESLKSFLNDGVYNIARLPTIYTLLRFIEDKNYIKNFDINVEETMINAFHSSIKTDEHIPDNSNLHDSTRYTYDERKTKEEGFKNLITLIEDKIASKRIEKQSSKVQTFFKNIGDSQYPIWTLIEEFGHNELFNTIAETNNTQLFCKINNKGISKFEGIIRSEILRVGNAGEFGYKHKSAFEEIIQTIKKYINSDEPSNMRKLRLLELIECMERAKDHLENTRVRKT